jgi:hypothetical protein
MELAREAEADRFHQQVKALGGPDAFNRFVFAEGLPPASASGCFTRGREPSGPT